MKTNKMKDPAGKVPNKGNPMSKGKGNKRGNVQLSNKLSQQERKTGKNQPTIKKSKVQEFEEVAIFDHKKMLPNFYTIIERNENFVGLEDLQVLQYELEIALGHALKGLEDMEKKCTDSESEKLIGNEEDNILFGSYPLPGSLLPIQTFRKNIKKSCQTARIKSPKKKTSDVEDVEETNVPTDYVAFMSYVEKYSGEITTEDRNNLEAILKTHEDGLIDCAWDPNASNTNDLDNQNIVDGILNKAKSVENVGGNSRFISRIGHLAQKLASCFVGKNIFDFYKKMSKETVIAARAPSRPQFIESLNLCSPSQSLDIEKRIAGKLQTYGILIDVESRKPGESISDKVKKLQAELKVLTEKRLAKKKRKLLEIADNEISKQEKKKKLKAVEAKVIQAFQDRLQKKKKNDKMHEEYVKILKERETLAQELEEEVDLCSSGSMTLKEDLAVPEAYKEESSASEKTE